MAPSALDRVELCVIGGERFTNGTTTGEPDYLACNFSYKNADVPGKPFLPKGNAFGLIQRGQVFLWNQPLICCQSALDVHVRYCGCIPHLGKPDRIHARTGSIIFGVTRSALVSTSL